MMTSPSDNHICGDPNSACDADCMERAHRAELRSSKEKLHPLHPLVTGLAKIRRRVAGEWDGTWMLHSEACALLEEIERLQQDLARTESAHVAVMAENRHYKRERDAYRALAGIGFNGTDEADELAKIDPPWERDAEAMRRRQERNLTSMKAIADAVRAAQPPGDGRGA